MSEVLCYLGSDLVAALAGLDVDDLTHGFFRSLSDSEKLLHHAQLLLVDCASPRTGCCQHPGFQRPQPIRSRVGALDQSEGSIQTCTRQRYNCGVLQAAGELQNTALTHPPRFQERGWVGARSLDISWSSAPPPD